MKLTNVTGLPAPLYAALLADDYDDGGADITATGLLAPPRQKALEVQHRDMLSEDAADMARILIGKALHFYIWWASVKVGWRGVLEAARAFLTPDGLVQLTRSIAALSAALSRWDALLDNHNDNRRLFIRVAGWLVSGQTDRVSATLGGEVELLATTGHTIDDYKTMRVNEWRRGLREEREQQLNVYAELHRANGYEVNRLRAICVFVDFSPRQARMKAADYPPASIVNVDIPLWPQAQAQAFILDRVLAHQAARRDVESVLCSEKERWAQGGEWAVMKPGAKRSTKNFPHDELAAAEALAAEVGGTVESREREYARCEDWCKVGAMGLCAQWNGER